MLGSSCLWGMFCLGCYWHHQHQDPLGPNLTPTHSRDPHRTSSACSDLNFLLTPLILRSINSLLWQVRTAGSSILILKTACVSSSSICLGYFYKDGELINLKPIISELIMWDNWSQGTSNFAIKLFSVKLSLDILVVWTLIWENCEANMEKGIDPFCII